MGMSGGCLAPRPYEQIRHRMPLLPNPNLTGVLFAAATDTTTALERRWNDTLMECTAWQPVWKHHETMAIPGSYASAGDHERGQCVGGGLGTAQKIGKQAQARRL
jgi:hypothetical protein